MKKFYVQTSIGKAKYIVNLYPDGALTHPDGSEFWGIRIFSNKRKLEKFIKGLRAAGYEESK